MNLTIITTTPSKGIFLSKFQHIICMLKLTEKCRFDERCFLKTEKLV